MQEVISVRFRGGCKAYFFDPRGAAVREGDAVVVETAQGAEFGTCVCGNHMVEDHAVIQPLRPLVRLASDEDRRTVERNAKREKEAAVICERKIAEHGLEMKLVDVECSFEGNKVIFFFTADGRVDFRELVRDLAGVFHARIELRQIGVRDEAKMLGGLGICGQPFCCQRFLDEFQPVSIKMAKTQNLSLNPTKISGSCGRLMCCLKYEQNAYEDAQARMPKNDSFVQTPDGPGNVSAVNLVKETVTVRLDDAPEAPKTYQTGEIIVLRNGKGSRDGIDIPARPARIAQEPELDIFGMEIPEITPAGRTFRVSAPPERMKDARRSSRGGEKEKEKEKEKSARPAAERPEKADKDEGKAEGGQRRRGHRGGRGRRGGEKNEAQRQQPRAAQGGGRETAPEQKPRPLRFGTSIPFAAAPEGAESKDGEHKGGRRRGRRSHRGGRGRRGGEGAGQTPS